MFLLGIGLGKSKGLILNHIFLGITALILTSAVAHARDLNNDLIKAAGKGNERKVLALLQKGADVNAADKLGWTPLKRAAENNKVDVVDLLIENGAMIDTLNGSPIPSYAGIAASGYTALHRAAWDGRTEAVKVLIEHGAALDLSTDEKADEGYTALHLAVARGRTETVKVLMEHGAALDLPTVGGGTALSTAFDRDDKELVTLLIQAGAEQSSLFLTSQWREAEKKNNTESYRTKVKKYPNTVLATEANHRIANSEYAFFQTARIGTKEAVMGFIKSHASSKRIPIASAYLEYLQEVNPSNIASARKFIDSSPDNPFARIAEVQFPLMYLQAIGASPYLNPNIEIVGVDFTGSVFESYGVADKLVKRRRDFISVLGDELEREFGDARQNQPGAATHLIDVFASADSTPPSPSQPGISFTKQFDMNLATMNLGFSDPTIRSMQRQARGRVIGSLAASLTSLLLGRGGGGGGSGFFEEYTRESFGITIRAAGGDVLYSEQTSLNSSQGRANLRALLNQPSAQVRLASSMVNLRGANFGDELPRLALNNDFESVKALVSTGVDLDVDNELSMTPLMAAVYNGSIEMASFLIKQGATVDARNESGTTALIIAVAEQSVPMVAFLLNNGSDLNLADRSGSTPLMIATNNAELVKLLLEQGPDVNHQDLDGRTALIMASQEGHEGTVQALLAEGAEIDHQTNNGWTALYLASQNGHEGIVKALLAEGANVNLRANDGETALKYAKTRQIKQLLKAAGAVPSADTQVSDGKDLLKAASTGDLPQVRTLLEKGIDIEYQNRAGATALIVAIYEGHEGIVQALLAEGAEIDHQTNNNGWTALMMAAARGHEGIVKALLAKGANVNIRESDGDTALKLADTRQIKRLLRASGATQ